MDEDVDVPRRAIQYIDDNVTARLPHGTKIKGIFPHGISNYWTGTAEIQTEQADGSLRSFFLKTNSRDQYSGEFAAMKTLNDVAPQLTPVPIAHGTYASDPSVYFFLCNFHDMTDDIPDIQKFTAKLAELHMKGISPNGKYGFHVPVFFGRWPQETTWTDSWEEFFRKYMKRALALEEQSQGPDAELKTLSESLFSKVIPRLLRPLETGGRQIRPRLVHGNLWDGNTSTDIETGLPLVYDACSIYAHNEYELGPWHAPRHKIGKPYVKAYNRHFPISSPEEDFEDRHTLYGLRFDTMSSAAYPGNLRFRKIMKEDMRILVEKFPEGYEGWERVETKPAMPAQQRRYNRGVQGVFKNYLGCNMERSNL